MTAPRSPALPALLVLASLLAGPPAASAAGSESVARRRPLPVATADPAAVRAALEGAARESDRIVADWLAIARIPALPGEEAARAAHVADLLRGAGLATRILPDGNVEGVLRGRKPGLRPAVLAAHLDALHAPSPDNPVRLDGDRVVGPGVLDDASGLTVLVSTARLLSRAGWRGDRDVRFVATVSEEVGLVGARSYLERDDDLTAFVSIDGILGAVDHGATGILWLKLEFRGRGGHALLSTRTPSPAFAAGRAIADVAAIASTTDAPLNVSMLSGGSRPNAIPTEASFSIDLRSDDPRELARLRRDVLRVARASAEREGVELGVEVLQDLPAVAATDPRSRLVTGAADILGWLGLPATVLARGSSDHNAALLRGIPGIAVGATVGRDAHAPTETADRDLIVSGVQQGILLAVLVGEGTDATSEAVAQ